MTNKSVESVNPWQSVIQTIPPGYKQTEVGVIPKEWDTKPIGEITQIFVGRDVKTCQFAWQSDNEYRYPVFSNTVENYGLYGFYNFVEYEGNSLTIVGRGIGLGKAFARSGGYGAIGRLLVLFPSQKADPRFLAEYFNKYIRIYDESSGIPQLTGISLAKYVVPLPTLGEQRAIANALTDVDALITALDKLIAKKRDVKQAAMQELLTGKRRLVTNCQHEEYRQTEIGRLPSDWEILPLKHVSSMHGRIGWQGLQQSEFTMNPDDPFLVTGMNFKEGEIRWDEVYHIPQKRYDEAQDIQLEIGDVLVTKDGTIGKLLYIDQIPYPGKASLNSHLLVFRPLRDRFVPKFMFYQFGSKTFHDHVELEKSGTTFFGITQESIGKYIAFLPPVAEQFAIADVLSYMDTEISALEQKRDKTRQLKQGMMQELLTGRIRLV